MQPNQEFRTRCPDGAANCLGVGFHPSGGVILSEIQDSKPIGPQIILASSEWTAFLAGAKAGEFDQTEP